MKENITGIFYLLLWGRRRAVVQTCFVWTCSANDASFFPRNWLFRYFLLISIKGPSILPDIQTSTLYPLSPPPAAPPHWPFNRLPKLGRVRWDMVKRIPKWIYPVVFWNLHCTCSSVWPLISCLQGQYQFAWWWHLRLTGLLWCIGFGNQAPQLQPTVHF